MVGQNAQKCRVHLSPKKLLLLPLQLCIIIYKVIVLNQSKSCLLLMYKTIECIWVIENCSCCKSNFSFCFIELFFLYSPLWFGSNFTRYKYLLLKVINFYCTKGLTKLPQLNLKARPLNVIHTQLICFLFSTIEGFPTKSFRRNSMEMYYVKENEMK